MAAQAWWSRTGVLGAGAVLAVAVGLWQGGVLAGALGLGTPSRPPARERAAERPEGVAAGAGGGSGRTFELRGDTGGSAFEPVGQTPKGSLQVGIAQGGPVDPEAEAAQHEARLTDEMKRLVRDLEYSPGLKEPPQQTIQPSPEPWRPDPEAIRRPPPVIEAISPRGGRTAGGVQVVIRGRNLQPAQVMFGPAAARITAATADAVTVVAPPSPPGPVTIALTNSDGTYALSAEPFTYEN